MAKERYNIKKSKLNKQNYPKIIDTQFTQLNPPTPEPVVEPTVDNFFELYNDLFYDIPKEGETDSHQFLIAQSTEYAGIGNSEEIEALITEIDNLRAQLLEANEKILELTEQNVASTQIEIDSALSRTNTNIPGVNVASSPASTY